jgi:hypothetical protein
MGAIVGIGAGALLDSPVIAVLRGPLANADRPDLTGGGGIPDTFSYDDDTSYAIDNYLATTNFDLDI